MDCSSNRSLQYFWCIRINGDYLYTYWTINDYTSSPVRVQQDKLVIGHGYGNTGLTTCCGSVLHLLETGKNYGFNGQ